MSEASIPYLSVNFGEAGGKFSWKSHDEIIEWINTQMGEWSWLSQQNLNPTNIAFSSITQSCLVPARDALNQALQYPGNPDQIKNCLVTAKNYLEGLFSKNEWLLSNSSYRKYIFEIRDSGRALEAALIVAYLLNIDLNQSPLVNLMPAIIEFELFKRGNKDRLKIENISLKNLVGQMTTALTEHKELQINQEKDFFKFNEDLSSQSDERSKEFNKYQEKRTDIWDSHIIKTDEELSKLTATYDTHMALAAPVNYWESKRVKHRNFAIGSFILLCVCMFVFGYELFAQITGGNALLVLNKPVIQKTLDIAINQAQLSASSPSPVFDFIVQSKIGAYILLVTLVFWFIRLLVRLFLSNIHLENDAAERVTMAKTYLSLIRDGSFERKEHIGTILAALFRPTGDGIVKDEGLPPTAMEWLTKLSGKN